MTWGPSFYFTSSLEMVLPCWELLDRLFDRNASLLATDSPRFGEAGWPRLESPSIGAVSAVDEGAIGIQITY